MTDDIGSSEFNLLYSQATDLYKAFPDYQFKTVAALMVIIGWLITSDGARAFIALNAAFAFPATAIAFTLLTIFKALWIRSHYHRMEKLHRRLVELAPSKGIAPDSVAALRPEAVVSVTYLLVTVLVCGAAIMVVWLICYPVGR